MIDIEAIEARANAATESPWILGDHSHSERTIRARGRTVAGVIATVQVDWLHEAQRIQQAANATFIAHARTDVSELVAEVKRLRELLEAK